MLSNSRSRGQGALRGLGVLGILLVWLTVAGFGGMAQGRLGDVQENDAAAFLPANAESTQVNELQQAFAEDASLPALVVVESDTTLTEGQLARAQAFASSLADLPLGPDAVLGDVLLAPVVVVPSEDGRALLLPVSLDSAAANEQIGEERVVNQVVEMLREAAAADLVGDGLEVWVTGPAGFIADLVTAFGGIDSLLLLVALSVVLVILVLVYRSPVLPFAVILTSVFALTAAALVVYHLAAAGILVLNGQSQGILFILVVGAATDYSLLLVARYREELRKVASPFSAMRRALRASIEPIAASAGTVIAGLLCLLLSDLTSNSSLGPVAAIGIAAAFLAALTLLPALLLVAGRRSRGVFWPRIPHLGSEADGTAPGVESLGGLEARSGLWGRVSRLVGRHDRRVWVSTAIVLLAASAWLPTFRADGTSETDVFLTDVDSVTGQEVLATHFDAGDVQPVVVISPETDAQAVLAAVQEVPGVAEAIVVVEASGPPGAPPAPDAPAVVVDGQVRIDATTVAASQSQEAVAVVGDIRAAVREVSDQALVGGAAAERLDTQLTSTRDLLVIVPTVLAVILLVLVGLLRSVVAPVLIVLANLLSFGATLGIGALVFNHVLGFPGADAAVPLYAFVFLVALGIDYSIFLMTRVREESLTHGTREGVRRGLSVTGGVITSAGVVLAATFGALAVLPLLFLLQLSFLVALGVLIDTLVVRTLLVPGLVHDVGRASWWPWKNKVPPDRSVSGSSGTATPVAESTLVS
ncbi:MMPL family transporter [Actinotalea sp. K2]|uniref:MMPL family transporter n=1 Tax=Actinotalea sp. K2 TaxID=2939438 RepID=UPI002017FA00|nr:MMPL family transporter [Actinotalea sp. K2]MCL3860711.1 MMPL family transporter [Actinotalea sp. K2]